MMIRVTVRDFGPPPRVCDCPRRPARGREPAQGDPGSRPRQTGRDAPPKTRWDACEFAAKSKTARRFVTLDPPRGCATVRGGRRGGAQGGPGSRVLFGWGACPKVACVCNLNR